MAAYRARAAGARAGRRRSGTTSALWGRARRAASHGREDTVVGDEATLGDDGAASHGRRSVLDEGAGDDGAARARAGHAARGRRVGRAARARRGGRWQGRRQ